MSNGNSKISIAEAVLLLMIVGTADLIEVVTDIISPVPIIGQIFLILNPLLDLSVTLIIQFWLRFRGARGEWALVGNLIEFIPYIDILPIRTVGLLATIYVTNKRRPRETAIQ